jgi:AhpD family alkylhydroperoxidase
MMKPRIPMNPARFPDVLKAMFGLNAAIEKSTLEHKLLHLVKVRASQINGCGYCIDMHTKDARLDGETEQRLYLLNAWHEAPMYSPRERAALAWTEAVTRIDRHEVTDELYAQAREQFSEDELVALTLAIVTINGWNRFSIAFNATPGTYQAGSLKRASV